MCGLVPNLGGLSQAQVGPATETTGRPFQARTVKAIAYPCPKKARNSIGEGLSQGRALPEKTLFVSRRI